MTGVTVSSLIVDLMPKSSIEGFCLVDNSAQIAWMCTVLREFVLLSQVSIKWFIWEGLLHPLTPQIKGLRRGADEG